MKKFRFLYFLLAVGTVLSFASCSDDNDGDDNEILSVIDFENVTIPDTGFVNNLEYQEKGIRFSNNYTVSSYGAYWEGFSYSRLTDRTTPGLINQYSVYASGGADQSQTFALAYDSYDSPTNFQFISDQSYKVKSVMVNNSTYAALSVKEGDSNAKQFEEGDWFKVIFTGYNVAGEVGKTVEFYLADYRDGKTYICNAWTKVDLQSLGSVNKVTITFDSSDKGEYGVNTPKYVCLDNLTYVSGIR